MTTTLVSEGHLASTLKQGELVEKINHISTAGSALVLYFTVEKLSMIEALEDAAKKIQNYIEDLQEGFGQTLSSDFPR